MTNIPELTALAANILRTAVDVTHEFIDCHDLLEAAKCIGDDGKITDLGRAALAAYDAKKRAAIRVEAMRECEEIARDNSGMEDGAIHAANDIREKIAKEQTNG